MGRSKERADYRFVDILGGIETLDASYRRQNFSRHIHEGYTVGVIEAGAQRFFVREEIMLRLKTALF